MIKAHSLTMARYHGWAYDRLLASLDAVSDADWRADLGGGTTVALVVGDTPLGASTVKADGTFAFTDVVAQKGGTGDLGYVVKVGDLKPVSLDISVKDFTIVSYKRVSAGLRFRVAAGAWKSGTIIELTRDGAPVSKIEVTSPGAEVILFSPDQPGFYQVQVSTSRGVVYGLEVQPVL